MFFCPNCNNSLLITQQVPTTQPSQEELSETPVAVSSSDVSESTEQPSGQKGGNKKGGQKTPKLSTTTVKAYFKCSNCGYTQEIEQGTLILSKAPENKKNSDYISDQSTYKYMINDDTLPHTRNYICPNKECKSHNDYSLRDAVWFKPYRNSYTIVTICKACQTTW